MEAPKLYIPLSDTIINFKEFYNIGDYYMKLFYTDNEKLNIICYDIKKLDGICYENSIGIQEIYNLNNIFRQYTNIKDIFELINDLINEQKFNIIKNNENNIIFSFTITDIKRNNQNVEFILANKNSNNTKEYIDILSNEIRNLRNENNNNNKEIKELKEEIKIIKEMIIKINIKNNGKQKLENKNNKNEKACLYCGSQNNLKKCICGKYFCEYCISNNKNIQCKKECFLFNNNLNTLTSLYQISKFPLPKNFKQKFILLKCIWFDGITFDSNIINEKDDHNSPKYNIYNKYEGRSDFYTYKKGWISNYFKLDKGIKEGDDLIIKLKEGKLYYLCNGESIGDSYSLDLDEINNKNMYLLIHRRNTSSECKLEYIYELID